MATLVNDYLKIDIRTEGAELTSVYSEKHDLEFIWPGNAEIWGWHAPNLFPVVGGCLNNQLLIDGKYFPMQRHGFARHRDFKLVEQTAVHAKFSLRFDEETLAVYPYRFEFQILYDLSKEDLRITYKVINLCEQTIYFSVGGHPAFNAPFFPNEKLEDYFLEFDKEEILEAHLLSGDGLFTGQTQQVATLGNQLPLTRGLFDQDALVFKNISSKRVSLKSRNHDKHVSIKFSQFNYLGIWSKPDANFVCIEPWLGCADKEGAPVDIKQKEAIQKVEHGHVFEAVFTIGFHA